MRIPENDWIELVVVGSKADEADDWIMEKAAKDDFVVTQDLLLAERLLKEKEAQPITPHGKIMTMENIGSAIAGRELRERLRQWEGEQHGGPPPFTKGHRSTFLQNFHQMIEKTLRESGN